LLGVLKVDDKNLQDLDPNPDLYPDLDPLVKGYICLSPPTGFPSSVGGLARRVGPHKVFELCRPRFDHELGALTKELASLLLV
jgi:hypothetical protein